MPVCVLLGILGIQGQILQTLCMQVIYACKTEGQFDWKKNQNKQGKEQRIYS